MGSAQTKTRSKKGVVYSRETQEIVDCLFCRIAHGQSPPNQLWYADDRCVVFIPRAPVARLHLLVVPLEHIQNISTLTEEHRSLLEHMKKVSRPLASSNTHSLVAGSNRTTSRPLSTYRLCRISFVATRTTADSVSIQSRPAAGVGNTIHRVLSR